MIRMLGNLLVLKTGDFQENSTIWSNVAKQSFLSFPYTTYSSKEEIHTIQSLGFITAF